MFISVPFFFLFWDHKNSNKLTVIFSVNSINAQQTTWLSYISLFLSTSMVVTQPYNNQLKTLCEEIKKLPRDGSSRLMAKARGLDIVEVAWEDTARTKNSALGPNISDLTLLVADVRMPLFRYPNFTDYSWDVPMDKVSNNHFFCYCYLYDCLLGQHALGGHLLRS
jgi:hypothetical protein